jgi:GT2 family glycosyltransferase
MVRERFPQVELIALDENLGFAKGNNIGLRRVPECEYVLLLNPDTEVQPGAIATLLAAMPTRSDVAMATSRLFYGDGTFQHSAFRFPGLSQLYVDLFPVPGRLYESRLNGRYPRERYEAGRPFEIDHPLGAVMLLRGDAMRQVGLFDESFALYCEEIDWAARFKEAGWRNICLPSAQITHHEGRSTSQVKVNSFVKLWTARYQLHTKHPQFAPLPLARLIVTQGMKRKMRVADAEMRAACERVIQVWNPKS